MNFIKNLKVKNKLIILVTIPLVSIMIMAGLVISSHITAKNQYSDLEKVIQLNVMISKLVHETQKERGATAGFLGSKGKKFANKLPAQRLSTNTKIKEFKAYIKKSQVKGRNILFFYINHII